MTPKKSPKKRGGIKLEPLKGQFFDIKPSKVPQKPVLKGGNDYFRFVLVTVIAFLILGLSNAYVLGRDLFWESQEAAYAGYENLKNGMDSLLDQDTSKAGEYFMKAESSFYELSQTTSHLTDQRNHLLAESLYLDTADKLIDGAMEVTQIGQELTGLIEGFSELPEVAMTVAGGGDGSLIEELLERKAAFDEILALAASLQRKVTTLNERVLPENLREKLVSARGQIGELMATMMDVDANFEVLLRLLGDQVPHRYLILLQNNHELRATGGFIGSYLIVDVNDGVITKLQAKDVYESDGQLAEVVKAPPGINQVADRLYMRDANYSPDFPTSAQSIMWFLEHSKGPSVDTVIAIDQTVVEELLALTGPVVLPGFPFQLTAQNFTDIISFHSEAKISDSSTPKQLLFDLIPMLQDEFASASDVKVLGNLVVELVESGHIQAYSVDSRVQELLTRFKLDGGIVRAGKKTDYLGVVTTAIGGNKSDQYMKTHLHHQSFISEKGNIDDQITIKKNHTWNQAAERKVANLIDRYGTGQITEESLYFILGRGPNVDYIRVYVPLGSQLQDASGIDLSQIEVSQDLGYTVFAYKHGPVNAGDSKTVSIRYRLPFSLSFKPDDNYEFIARRQAGADNIELKKEIHLDDSLIVMESYPPTEGAFSLELSPVLETALNKNQIFMSAISKAP